jgi:biopolymer transport protein ExbD
MKIPPASASINVTPLVDVFLVLLAALLLAAATSTKPLPTDLPQTSLSGAPVARASLVLALDAQGRLTHEGRTLDAEALRAMDLRDRAVELAPARHVEYEALVRAVDMLSAAGASEVRLLAR